MEVWTFIGILAATVAAVVTCVAADGDYPGDVAMQKILREDSARLRQELLNRPVVKMKTPPKRILNKTEMIPMTAYISVLSVLSVDDAMQTVTSLSYISLNWQDYSLAWNTSNFSHILSLEVPVDDIWTPDLTIPNSIGVVPVLGGVKILTLYSNGEVFAVFPLHLVTVCLMDHTDYPFDTQSCSILFFSFSAVPLKITAMTTHHDDSILNQLPIGSEWDTTAIEVLPFSYTERDSPYPYPQIVLKLRRKTLFSVVCLVVPVIVTSGMNTFVFLLPINSGEKVSFVVSIFVSTTVFLSYITSVMPRGLDKLPNMMKLLLGVISQSLVILFCTIVVLRLHHRQRRQSHGNRPAANEDHDDGRADNSNSTSTTAGSTLSLSEQATLDDCKDPDPGSSHKDKFVTMHRIINACGKKSQVRPEPRSFSLRELKQPHADNTRRTNTFKNILDRIEAEHLDNVFFFVSVISTAVFLIHLFGLQN